MDFDKTGLPADVTVYKAYTTFAGRMGMLPKDQQSDYPLRVAQVIHSTIGADARLIALALLTGTPDTMQGIVEKRFGADIAGLVSEASRHMRTGQVHLMQASDDIKIVTVASAIVSFGDFRAMMDEAENLIMLKQSGMMGEMKVNLLPDMQAYQTLAEDLFGRVNLPALENLFKQELQETIGRNLSYMQKLSEAGFFPGVTQGGHAMRLYPDFEETGLLDDPRVREAYAILTEDQRVLPEDFVGAVEVARLLSDIPASKNPTAIAAALLDVGIRELSKDDFELLQNRIDWDVLEILEKHSIHEDLTSSRLMKAPVEFRQIAFANMISLVEGAQQGAYDLVDMARSENMPPDVIAAAFRPIGMIVLLSRKNILPASGTTDAPELEEMLQRKTTQLFNYISQHLPKPPENRPQPPAPPTP